MDADRLKAIPVFARLSDKERKEVARRAEQIDVREGKQLVTEGQFGYEFFAIEDGQAEVLRDGQRIRDLGPGDFFGELALLEEERRTATVVARSDMRLIVMHRRDFRSIADDMPAVAQRLEEALRGYTR